MNQHFGARFRVLHCYTDQMLTNALAQMNLTSSQGRILGFIAHSPTPPCPRDIEEIFTLSHPSVSGTLKRMEEKGFLEFRPDETDRRSKRIYLLPKGKDCHSQIGQTIARIEATITAGFSPAEQAQFSGFLERALRNVGADCCHQKKEETTP